MMEDYTGGYGYLHRRGIDHYPPDVAKKLNLKRWYRDFFEQMQIEEVPFFKNYFMPQFERLNAAGIDDDEQLWLRLSALLGLLDTRFFYVDLALPENWVKDRAYCHRTYSLSDTNNLPIDSSELFRWSEKYSNPENVYIEGHARNPWELQQNLANEFVDLFFKRVRKLATSTTKKSRTGEVVNRNSDLRLLLSEAELYGSMALQNAFYHRLPDFLKEFENEEDPALQHMFSSLKRMFVDSDTEVKYGFLKGMFASYWETLEGMVTKTEGRKTVQIMKSEVENYLVDLLRENNRLERKIDEWNAE